ncbi:metal ABC transporter substrate-binding protein [Luteolibacter sp. AS25]|uniref:metal ABC transporter substrate-binding protein n=1 Tax=Luteolibacter sp. AS25 TaxID=3135776 RepID=UPI00398BA4C7
MKLFRIFAIFCSLALPVFSAPMKVVSLHPLITDLLHQVGGEKLDVIDLIGKTGDPHSFQPSAEDLVATQDAKVYFVSGMGMESYLGELKSIIGSDAVIVEVGKSLPALHGSCDHDEHGHEGHHHEIDPHWWHSVDHFRRATGVVSDKLCEIDPDNSEFYKTNANVYRSTLDTLEKWVKREVVRVPKDLRKLATAHESFNYFCDEYGFEAFSIQGLNREQMPDAVSLVKLIAELKNERVAAIFPELESNPKMLQSLTSDTGIRIAGSLIADGRGVSSYEEMIRGNVKTIVDGLTASQE